MSSQNPSTERESRRKASGRLSMLAGPLTLTGCGHALPLRIAPCAEMTAPAVKLAKDLRTVSTSFSVLTFNIEGLGWPARSGRAPSLQKIGRIWPTCERRAAPPMS